MSTALEPIRFDTTPEMGQLPQGALPGVNGYYWLRIPGQQVQIVRVMRPLGHKPEEAKVQTMGFTHNLVSPAFLDPRTLWFGPVEPPTVISR